MKSDRVVKVDVRVSVNVEKVIACILVFVWHMLKW